VWLCTGSTTLGDDVLLVATDLDEAVVVERDLLQGQPSGLVVSRKVARTRAYMRALVVPRVLPALVT
jgi:hypothetical protein